MKPQDYTARHIQAEEKQYERLAAHVWGNGTRLVGEWPGRWLLVNFTMQLENGDLLQLSGWHPERHVLAVPQG